jgi:NAD(P)-dependent dehydrogenase (short-subunit alcohol dehydrogenase family)
MRELRDRVAVVTGAGSGIGRALALTLAGEGMHVVVADVEQNAAERVAAEARARGVKALAVRTDVSDRASVQALAQLTFDALGVPHLLCNNAGVVTFKPVTELRDADWQWVIGVNLFGVIHGIEAFLPRMVERGGEAHVVNTSSVGGLVPSPGRTVAAYTTSKYAVAGLSEALRLELAPLGIGVTLLCPGLVATRLLEAGRNRPERLGGPERAPAAMRERPDSSVNAGLDATLVAKMVLDAIHDNTFYVVTGPNLPGLKARVEQRFNEIVAAYESSPA